MPDREKMPIGEADHARLARIVMRRQASLSLRVAAVFLTLLLGLPLVNRYGPGFANQSIYGFPANWLFLGVLFYPITVGLSVYFVRRSNRIEAESVHWAELSKSEARG